MSDSNYSLMDKMLKTGNVLQCNNNNNDEFNIEKNKLENEIFKQLNDNGKQLKDAKKKYCILTEPNNAENCYNNYLKSKYRKEAEEKKKNYNQEINILYNEIKELENLKNINNITDEYINDLINIKQDENKKIMNYLENDKNTTNVNERKTLYLSNQNDMIKTIKKYLIILYYIILILYIYFDVIMGAKYLDVKTLFAVILLAFIPLIIVNFTFSISLLILNSYKSLLTSFKTDDI